MLRMSCDGSVQVSRYKELHKALINADICGLPSSSVGNGSDGPSDDLHAHGFDDLYLDPGSKDGLGHIPHA